MKYDHLLTLPGKWRRSGVEPVASPTTGSAAAEAGTGRRRPRPLPGVRALRTTLRTAHLVSFGALYGGHLYGVPAERLWPALLATVTTGGGLQRPENLPPPPWAPPQPRTRPPGGHPRAAPAERPPTGGFSGGGPLPPPGETGGDRDKSRPGAPGRPARTPRGGGTPDACRPGPDPRSGRRQSASRGSRP